MLKYSPGRSCSLVEKLSPDENKRSFHVARVLVQEIIQLAALHPSGHRVICLDGITEVYFPPHPNASVP